MRRLLLVIALALAASAAQADSGYFYVGAGISKDKLSNITAPNGTALSDLDNTSWKVYAGVRPVSLFAVEADYLDLGSQTSTFVGGSARTSYKAFAGYAEGYLPIPVPFLDVFGKAGFARWNQSGSTTGGLFSLSRNGTEFAWGGGAQLHVGNIGGRLEYEHFNIPNTNGARLFSLSVYLNIM
jgi:hypothetical protein